VIAATVETGGSTTGRGVFEGCGVFATGGTARTDGAAVVFAGAAGRFGWGLSALITGWMTVAEVVVGVMSALTTVSSSPPTAAAAKPAAIPYSSAGRLNRVPNGDPAASSPFRTVSNDSASDAA
jgi:hypothetical protein